MKYLSVIQHTQSEWLGLMEDHLEGRRVRFGYSRPFAAGGQLPDANVIGDGLILLGGGPWGADKDGRPVPTLDEEISLARTCLMLEKPVIGLGLGAQILALAADGSVEPAPLTFEVGQARRVKDSGLNGFLPECFPNVVYMRDFPVPPDYAEILAQDQDARPALWQIGKNAFGFTGNIGVKRAMIEDLLMEFEEQPPDPAPGLDKLLGIKNDIEDALVQMMTGLIQLTGWMSQNDA